MTVPCDGNAVEFQKKPSKTTHWRKFLQSERNDQKEILRNALKLALLGKPSNLKG